ncbi:hypothetical protein H4R20_002764 [Coemansia guatemalensis]|uniref:Uncharacterized protein n=1 Tax=Coemansia guatemalensis TaxID=2761395 RepID=A0A9W8HX99_9FUNG|nr:hypothetical protein H4R20_002764 [Coemansia guatemalensis]
MWWGLDVGIVAYCRRCEVAQLRDSHLCDVSDNFMVSDVFDESPEIFAAMKGLQDESNLALRLASKPSTGENLRLTSRSKRRRYTMTPSKDMLEAANENGASDSESLTKAPKIVMLSKSPCAQDASPRADPDSLELTPVYAGQSPKQTILLNSRSPAPAYSYSNGKAVNKGIDQTASTPQSPVTRGSIPTSASPLPMPRSARRLDMTSPEISAPFNADADNAAADAAAAERLSETAVNTPRPASTVGFDSPSKAKENGRREVEVVVRRTTRSSKANADGNAMSGIVDAPNCTPQRQGRKRKAVESSPSGEKGSDKESAASSTTAATDASTGAVAAEKPAEKKSKTRASKAKAASDASPAAAPKSKAQNGAVSVAGAKAGKQAAADAHSPSTAVQPSSAKKGNSVEAPVAAHTDKASVANAKKPTKGSVAKKSTANGAKVAAKAPAPAKSNGTASSSQKKAPSGEVVPGVEPSNGEVNGKQASTAAATKGKAKGSKPAAKSKASAPNNNAAQSNGAAKITNAPEADAGGEDDVISSSDDELSETEGSQPAGESASSSSDEESLIEEDPSSGDEEEEDVLSNGETSEQGRPKVVVQSNKTKPTTTGSPAAANADGSEESGTESEGDFSVDSDSSLESDEGEDAPLDNAINQPEAKLTKNSKGAARKTANGSTAAKNQRVGATNGTGSTQLAGPTTPPATPPPAKAKAATGAAATPGTKRRTPKRTNNDKELNAPVPASRRKITLSRPATSEEDNASSESEKDESDIPLRRLSKLPVLGTPTMPRRTSGVLELAQKQRAGKDGSGVMSISQLASAKPYDELRKKMAKYASARGMTNVAGGDSGVQNKDESAGESSSDSDSSSSSGDEMDVEFDTDVGKGGTATAGSNAPVEQRQQQQQQQGRWRPIRFAGAVKLTGSAKARRRKSALMNL